MAALSDQLRHGFQPRRLIRFVKIGQLVVSLGVHIAYGHSALDAPLKHIETGPQTRFAEARGHGSHDFPPSPTRTTRMVGKPSPPSTGCPARTTTRWSA